MPTTTRSTSSTRPTAPSAPSGFLPLREALQTAMLQSLPEHVARMGWSRAQIGAHQGAQLRALLAHAIEHSPFHARRLRGVDPAAADPEDLTALPVMTKAEMMNELDDVFTDRLLTQRAVDEALAAAGPNPATPLGRYLALTSGGSSGERGVFVLDAAGAVQFFGSLSRGLVARLSATGGPPPGGFPIAMVAAASPVHATGIAVPLTAGGRLPFHFRSVPVTLPLGEIVERLNALAAPGLYGYPTVLAQLAGERAAGRLRISPVMVTSTSETCTPELRAAITAGFGVPLVDTFGSTEGLVGSSPPHDDVLTFAEDGCIVELVDERYRPVPPGAPSAAVLVTNLANRVQPLVRYVLTDRFQRQPAASGHGHLRTRVQGRADEVFDYRGVSIHPLVVRSVLVQVPDVLEYQVRQTASGLDVMVVADHGLDTAAVAARLTEALAGAGLADPQVTVSTAPGLARHPATGKLRRFVPLV